MVSVVNTTTNDSTNVKEDEPVLRVLQITDTHLYADPHGHLVGLNTDRSFTEVMRKVFADNWPADLILATGDIVHDGTETGYKRFKARFEELGTRTLVIPGNHDAPEVMRSQLQGGLVTNSPHAMLGGWQFVMLDSTVPKSAGGHLDADELETLDRYLGANRDHHALICLHHHPVSVDCRWIDTIGVDNGDELFGVLDRHPHVRGVVWGHIHQAFDSERRGVRLMASPSTCIQFKPREPGFTLDDAQPGYRWLRLYADGRIETGVERLDEGAIAIDLQCSGYE